MVRHAARTTNVSHMMLAAAAVSHMLVLVSRVIAIGSAHGPISTRGGLIIRVLEGSRYARTRSEASFDCTPFSPLSLASLLFKLSLDSRFGRNVSRAARHADASSLS